MSLDTDIDKIIPTITENLNRLPDKEIALKKYTFSNMAVKNISKTHNGKTIADIEIDINKKESTHTIQGEETYINEKGEKNKVYTKEDTTPRKTETLQDQWYIYNLHLKKPELSDIQKAVLTLEFKQSILDNFENYETTEGIYKILIQETVSSITNAFDYIYQGLIQSTQENKKDDYFPLPVNILTEKAPELNGIKMFKIINLHKGIFINTKNYEKIQKHEKQGKFKQRIPLRLKLSRQIVYEWGIKIN